VHTLNEKPYKFVLVAIAKNEGKYIEEWVAYHKALGFDFFYIADNGSSDNTPEILQRLDDQGVVSYTKWDHSNGAQISWYREVISHYGNQCQYMAFFDIDEFLAEEAGTEALQEAERVLSSPTVGALVINWKIFGSAGFQREQPGLVLSRFRMASKDSRAVNKHIKTIVKPEAVQSLSLHSARLRDGFCHKTPDGSEAVFIDDDPKSGITETVCKGPLRINHYNIKSFEEFVRIKMTRGRANLGPDNIRPLKYFSGHDFNDDYQEPSLKRMKETKELMKGWGCVSSQGSGSDAGLFFVHIPKTAGTSFRFGARSAYGQARVWQDYGASNSETTPEVKQWVYDSPDLFNLHTALVDQRIKVFGGHVNADKYLNLFGLRNCVAFVREPMQRIVSEYKHFVRHHGYKGSLESFFRQESMRNRQSRFLSAAIPQAYGLLGITEQYLSALEMLNARYDVEIASLIKNVADKVGAAHDIAPQDLQEMARLNQQDIRLYRTALELFNQRLSLYKDGLPFVHGCIQQCSKERVLGWAWWEKSDLPVEVDVLINQTMTGRCVATELRPGLLRWGVPRFGQVGFKLPLKATVGDKITCRVAMTGQVLGECIVSEEVK